MVLSRYVFTAVTHASIQLWEYMDVIRRFADQRCSKHLEGLAAMIDSMLSQPGTRNAIKGLFGLAGLEHDYDFVSTIEVSVQRGVHDSRLLIWSLDGVRVLASQELGS